VCHTDFCGDNIVITDGGRICVVDNEGLTLDSPEFDLARTWYRWPMTPTQQRAYAEGYGAHDHSARFADHFLHWALMAVLDSAAYRMRAHAASAPVPLARLTELLHTHGRNESFPRFLSRGGH
jgi:thiamine kinase-like enzyme